VFLIATQPAVSNAQPGRQGKAIDGSRDRRGSASSYRECARYCRDNGAPDNGRSVPAGQPRCRERRLPAHRA
jgi:hypothetical protein